jgi:hypothetical protein
MPVIDDGELYLFTETATEEELACALRAAKASLQDSGVSAADAHAGDFARTINIDMVASPKQPTEVERNAEAWGEALVAATAALHGAWIELYLVNDGCDFGPDVVRYKLPVNDPSQLAML